MQKSGNDSDNENTPKSEPENDSDFEGDTGFKNIIENKDDDESVSDSATLTDIDDSDIEEDEEGEEGQIEDDDDETKEKPSFVSGLSKLMKRVGNVIENIGSDTGSAAAEQGNIENSKSRKEKMTIKSSRKKLSRGIQPTQEELEQSSDDTDIEGDDEFEDDDDDDSKLKKFDKELREEYLVNFHPESLIQNYDEIYNLARVVRNQNGVIVDNLHKTLPIMTKYEKTRILGQRAKQINDGARPFIKVPEGVIDGYLIALKELEEKKIPFIIRRPLPNRGSEYWYVEDLEVII
jgi:DNA-directed RNA polymerase subunit K/omega